MPSTIGELLSAVAAAAPSRPAVTCGERTVTRAQLEAQANRLAHAYAARGVRQGDVVTVALPNGIEFFEACYAIWKLGATPAPVSARLPERELREVVALADAALVVGVAAAAVPDRASVPAGFAPDAAYGDEPPPRAVSPAWKIIGSGGSTGRPKLIVTTSSSELDLTPYTSVFRLSGEQVQLVPGPLYHNGPFSVGIVGPLLGQHVVVLPRFDAAAALEAIARHRVGFAFLVPTMMLRMLRLLDAAPGAHDLSSIEVLWHGGGPCPPWLKERWIELIGAGRLFEMYGGTEAQAFTMIDGVDWLAHRGSVGRPVFGEIKAVGGDGREVAPGEVGELLLRRPAGTPETYRYIGAASRTLPGGWESLGDMGAFDEQGWLFLADRQLDMLLVGGVNVYPAEVEAAVLEHPRVLSCAVVGLPDDELGQRVHAVVEADGELEEEALRAFAAERLVRYKVPRSFRFVAESLRDDAGKVRRSAVRERELALLPLAASDSIDREGSR
ncbi:AMP-binding protein [Conexibacter stalactiti]|uniref:AMP-binding protein n=1 Tax=Conexibacter stalactiti TaxID=1940611 RepID=A0ABU4HR39_9ACTN|nr:AMP-binding protein [Conexibacter stalactiti]MDW5595791.1 AMP-binding protein [Conexibacter stalactiti]MEC5036433.1 AMP-binding protein [Conexibacter stalactiti]